MSLGKIHTMDEAAAALRISRRSLHEIIKRHPFYFLNGNRKLFTDADLVKLTEALRPASAPRPSRAAGAPTLAETWARAEKALAKPARRRKP